MIAGRFSLLFSLVRSARLTFSPNFGGVKNKKPVEKKLPDVGTYPLWQGINVAGYLDDRGFSACLMPVAL